MSNIKKTYKRAVNWQDIKLVVFDCDGVLTDGRIIYGADGLELKNFDAHDGMGFMILRQTGIEVAVITGRESALLERRCNDLKIKHLYQGVARKKDVLADLMQSLGLKWDQIAYMGDDWNDIPCMNLAAFSGCPADALEEIRLLADYVSPSAGGRGAVRDFIKYILEKQGSYDKAVEAYLAKIS